MDKLRGKVKIPMPSQSQKDLRNLWQDITDGAALPDGTAELWLKTCTPVSLENGALVVDTGNAFVREQIERQFLPALNRSANTVGEKAGIPLSAVSLRASDPDEAKRKQVLDGRAKELAKSSFRSSLNPKYTFESFVVGKSNRMANAASLAVAEQLASSDADLHDKLYNPLFIWGGVGLGKTHLMHAICHYALDRRSNLNALYVSSEKFVNDFIQSIQTKHTSEFKNKYRGVDVLLIDDIQFIAGKGGSQEEFFHTFNTLNDARKQIVICSDRPPSELQDIEDRLRTRFNFGMVADIKPPDNETRIAILRQKAADMGRGAPNMPDEIISFLAAGIPSNIRDLEGALNRVIHSATLLKEDITIENVSNWLKDVLKETPGAQVTVSGIQATVAEHYGLDSDDLLGSKRTSELALARHVAMYLCREMMDGMSLFEIATAFRKKDHTTVIHAHDRISRMLKNDEALRAAVGAIKERLNEVK
ncbi:MAG: chromosomal replication initiator protein DnaA [Synergistaceae bacterium]|nr:chromosomal replication initiator protein DnaA [Synergistaceae bacterium]